MRMLGRIALVVFVAVIALVGVLAVGAASHKGSQGVDVALIAPPPATARLAIV
jgi:hypothetical protein